MDIREIDRKTQMKCLLSLEQDSPISTLLKSFDQAIPCFIYRRGSEIYLNMYFDKEDSGRKEITQLMNYPNSVDRDEFIVVEEKMSNVKEVEVMDEILQMPSVVLGQTYLFKGSLYLGFRFHQEFSRDVSAILAKFAGRDLRGKVADLGPISGMMSYVESMNRIIPLSMVRYMIPTKSVGEPEGLPGSRVEWLAEVVDSRISEGRFKTLIHVCNSGQALDVGDERWRRIDGSLYEAHFTNRFMSKVRERANENLIPRYSYIVRNVNEGEAKPEAMIEVSVFVPTVATETYTKTLFELAREFFDGEMYVTVIRKFSPDLWETF